MHTLLVEQSAGAVLHVFDVSLHLPDYSASSILHGVWPVSLLLLHHEHAALKRRLIATLAATARPYQVRWDILRLRVSVLCHWGLLGGNIGCNRPQRLLEVASRTQ